MNVSDEIRRIEKDLKDIKIRLTNVRATSPGGATGYTDMQAIADPGAPAAGYVRFFANGDHLIAIPNNDIWHDLSAGAKGVSSCIHTAITITDAGGLNITWSAGTIFDALIEGGSQMVDIAAQPVNQACAASNINYLFYDRSAGVLVLNTVGPDYTDGDFSVGHILTLHDDIIDIFQRPVCYESVYEIKHVSRTILADVIGYGMLVSEHAGGGAFDVDQSLGEFVYGGFQVIPGLAIDSTVTPIIRWYHNAADTWETDTNAQIDAANWDDTTDGANPVINTANKYYRSTFYSCGDHIHWVYPQVEYANVNAALEAPDPTPPAALEHLPKTTTVIMKGNAVAFPASGSDQWIDVRPMMGGGVSGTSISSHANLSDLAWLSAKHTGTISTMPGFDGAGAAEELTYTQVLAALSAQAGAAFDWNAQNLTNMGTGHDVFTDFVGNEHIDHTGVTLTAGTGLTGGGTIAANRTFDVDVGIADDKIMQVDMAAGLTVGDYVRATAAGLESRTEAEFKGDVNLEIGTDVLAEQTIGIADDNLLEVDMGAGLTNGDILRATAAGIESRTDAEILAQLSNQAGATFDWNDQRLENVLSLEVKDIAVDTTDDYLGFENHHKKTAGITDAGDDFYAHDNYVALDQAGGVIGYLSAIYTEAWLIDGTISNDLEAIYNKVVISGGVCSGDVIGSTDFIDMNGGSIDDLFGHITRLDVEAALTISGDVYGHYIEADIDTDPTGDVYMLYLKEYSNVDYGFYQDGSALNVLGGALQLDTVADAAADVDKFLVLDAGDVVDYRTGAEVLADLSGDAAAAFDWGAQDLDNVGEIDSTNTPTKTTAAWSKTIGATGDYADWATMIAAMPDLIAHVVTVTIQTGTTLTGQCKLANKHGTSDVNIRIKSARYYPTTGALPTADGAGTGADTMQDASVFTVNDYYNDCWVFIIDGTGTDNGFVQITDTVAADGEIFVAAWPGTQPDATSKYIIVGALFDGEGSTAYPLWLASNSIKVYMDGLGIKDSDYYGVRAEYCTEIELVYCGIYGSDTSGFKGHGLTSLKLSYDGLVNNNTDNNSNHSGITIAHSNFVSFGNCGISDNKQAGIKIHEGTFGLLNTNYGDNNGAWGTYAQYSGQARLVGVECSGSSGNHSDVGTAGNNNADQAAAY